MARTVYHVTTHPSGWQVKREGASQASGVFSTKQAAISRGRALCKANEPSQLIVHLADGRIETEWTYGDDPFPPSG